MESLGFVGLGVGVASFVLAAWVYLLQPRRNENRRLAVFLVASGAAVAIYGGNLFLADASTFLTWAMLSRVARIGQVWAYLEFLRVIRVPLTKPLGAPWMRGAVALAAWAGVATVLLLPAWWFDGIEDSSSAGSFRWESGPLETVLLAGGCLLFAFGLAVAVQAVRRARTAQARRKYRAYAAAFGAYDGLSLLYLAWNLSGRPFAAASASDAVNYVAAVLASAWLMGALAYGFLRANVLGIDLRAPFVIRQATVLSAAALGLFILTKAVEDLFPHRGFAFDIVVAAFVALTVRVAYRWVRKGVSLRMRRRRATLEPPKEAPGPD